MSKLLDVGRWIPPQVQCWVVLTRSILPLAVLCVLSASASTQEVTRPDVAALQLGDSLTIRLNGLLDEPIWRQAPVATEFRQREPHEGEAATLEVFFSANHLSDGVHGIA